jgi:hypothetical protein
MTEATRKVSGVTLSPVQVIGRIKRDTDAFRSGSGPDLEAEHLRLCREQSPPLPTEKVVAMWARIRKEREEEEARKQKASEISRKLAEGAKDIRKAQSDGEGDKKILGETQPEAVAEASTQPAEKSEDKSAADASSADASVGAELKARFLKQEELKEIVASAAKSKSLGADPSAAAAECGTELVPAPSASPLPQAPWIPGEIKLMNDKHAVISNLGGKCVVMEWVPSLITKGGEELEYQSFASFRERYLNRYFHWADARGRTESAPLAPYWLAHAARRQYEGLDLVPNGPQVLLGRKLNLWRGWGVQPRKGSWKLMRRHVAEVLANGNAKFEDFILKWTAWKYQNLGELPEVVLAFLGGKGTGKGVWGSTQMLVFGQHALQIFSTDLLTGKHNQHLQNKLFLFLDEAMWAGDRDAERKLKGLATEKWMMIEPKNVNAFQWPNHLGILMTGNAKWIVPASHDERRYAVNKVSERWKQNPSYFRPLFEEINSGGAAAMLYDLLALDLDGWHPRENVPQTQALVEQKMLGLTGIEQWYAHLLGIGELPHVRIPTMATSHSDGSRPPVPIDRDQGGADAGGAVG